MLTAFSIKDFGIYFMGHLHGLGASCKHAYGSILLL